MKKRMVYLLTISYICLCFTACGNRVEQQVELREKGIVYMEENGDYETAIACFNEALGKSVGKVTELEIDIDYYKAAAQFKAGLYDDALYTYSALIRYNKENFKPYFLRGCVYAKTGDINNARMDYDKAIACDKKNYELYIQIYQNLSSLGYEDDGLNYISDLFGLEDKSPEAKYAKGKAYYLVGQWSKAEEFLTEAVKKDVVEAKLYLAKLYQDEGLTEQAQALLDDYATSEEVNSVAMATLGDIESSRGNYEGALSYYQTGLNLDEIDNYPELYKGQVVALENLNRFGEAREVMARYLELYPDDEAAQREMLFLSTR